MKNALDAIAEEEPLDVKAHADAVMASLDRAPAKRQRVLVPLAVSGLALAAALLLGVGIGRGTKPADPGEFTARGGGSATTRSLGRDVAVDVLKADRDAGLSRLIENDDVTPNTGFAADGRNLGSKNACALVFIVDSARDVHWIHPQFSNPELDPSSVQIEPSTTFKGLGNGDGILFRDLAPGRANVVVMLTEQPLSVSAVEKLPGLTPADLRRRFPEADIRSFPINVHVP